MKTIYCDFNNSYRYQFNLSLNNQGYQFILMWNDILECFFLDMVGNKTRYSIPLSSGMVKEIDTNVWVSIQKGNDNYKEKVNPHNINSEYFLIFADEGDL